MSLKGKTIEVDGDRYEVLEAEFTEQAPTAYQTTAPGWVLLAVDAEGVGVRAVKQISVQASKLCVIDPASNKPVKIAAGRERAVIDDVVPMGHTVDSARAAAWMRAARGIQPEANIASSWAEAAAPAMQAGGDAAMLAHAALGKLGRGAVTGAERALIRDVLGYTDEETTTAARAESEYEHEAKVIPGIKNAHGPIGTLSCPMAWRAGFVAGHIKAARASVGGVRLQARASRKRIGDALGLTPTSDDYHEDLLVSVAESTRDALARANDREAALDAAESQRREGNQAFRRKLSGVLGCDVHDAALITAAAMLVERVDHLRAERDDARATIAVQLDTVQAYKERLHQRDVELYEVKEALAAARREISGKGGEVAALEEQLKQHKFNEAEVLKLLEMVPTLRVTDAPGWIIRAFRALVADVERLEGVWRGLVAAQEVNKTEVAARGSVDSALETARATIEEQGRMLKDARQLEVDLRQILDSHPMCAQSFVGAPRGITSAVRELVADVARLDGLWRQAARDRDEIVDKLRNVVGLGPSATADPHRAILAAVDIMISNVAAAEERAAQAGLQVANESLAVQRLERELDVLRENEQAQRFAADARMAALRLITTRLRQIGLGADFEDVPAGDDTAAIAGWIGRALDKIAVSNDRTLPGRPLAFPRQEFLVAAGRLNRLRSGIVAALGWEGGEYEDADLERAVRDQRVALDDTRAVVKRIGEAHEAGVERWRAGDPGGARRDMVLPLTRAELVVWLLGRLDRAALTREQAIDLARAAAFEVQPRPSYVQGPRQQWVPHEWVIEAIRRAASLYVPGVLVNGEPVLVGSAEHRRLRGDDARPDHGGGMAGHDDSSNPSEGG